MRVILEYNDEKKERLDIYISKMITKYTRSYIKTLNSGGKIKVNGSIQKAGYILKKDDVIEIEDVLPKKIDAIPENIELDIIYEDEDIIIVNKKKGMVVHPANGNYTGTLVNALIYSHKDNLSTINGVIRPGIVHRIDKDTSGILVVAKNDFAHKELSKQFKEHSIKREYIALVHGIIKEDSLTIDEPIGRNPKDRKKMAITNISSRNAITNIQVLERLYNSNVTLIKAVLETGRTHQIRVHMSSIKHPLVGDSVYSKTKNKFGVVGQALHAKTLGFIHPRTNKYIEFDSNLPEYFEELIKKLKNKENI